MWASLTDTEPAEPAQEPLVIQFEPGRAHSGFGALVCCFGFEKERVGLDDRGRSMGCVTIGMTRLEFAALTRERWGSALKGIE